MNGAHVCSMLVKHRRTVGDFKPNFAVILFGKSCGTSPIFHWEKTMVSWFPLRKTMVSTKKNHGFHWEKPWFPLRKTMVSTEKNHGFHWEKPWFPLRKTMVSTEKNHGFQLNFPSQHFNDTKSYEVRLVPPHWDQLGTTDMEAPAGTEAYPASSR